MRNGYRFPRMRIQIFSRVPEAGSSKTRLIPSLGPQGAADLQARMLRRSVIQAAESRLAPLELWGAPDCTHPQFAELAGSYPIALFAQPDGDLGARMSHAISRALRSGDAALLIGTDCPALNAAHIENCLQALDAGMDAAVIAAEDGGYVAIGLRRPAPWLFERMAWGSADVMAQTRARLRARRWSWVEPTVLWDIDEPADWVRLAKEYPELAATED